MENDSIILDHIIDIFNQTQAGQAGSEQRITVSTNEIAHNVPTFCFLLLRIVESDNYKVNYRFLALVCIRRFHQTFPAQFRQDFYIQLHPILLRIFESNANLLINQAAVVMSTIVRSYGPDFFPNHEIVILRLITNESTSLAGFDALVDLVQFQYNPPEPILMSFPVFLQGQMAESCCADKVLEICKFLFRPNLYDYLSTYIVPLILENYESFNTSAAMDSFTIVSLFFITTGDPTLGDFLSLCIETQEIDILQEGFGFLSKGRPLPFSQSIACSLYGRLAEDDDYTAWMTQNVLLTMLDYNTQQVYDAVVPLLDSCQNPNQILRTLNTLILNIDVHSENSLDLTQFLPFVLSHLHDEARGDAALCLSQIAQSQPDQLVNPSIDEILPLLADDDEIVVDKVIYALIDLLSFPFVLSQERFMMIFEAYCKIQPPHRCSMANILREYIGAVDDLSDQMYKMCFRHILCEFMDENIDQSMICFYAQLLCLFLNKIKPDFSQSDVDSLLCRIGETLDPLHLDVAITYCSLITAIMSTFPNESQSVLPRVADHLLAVFSEGFKMDLGSSCDESVWNLIATFLKMPGFPDKSAEQWITLAMRQALVVNDPHLLKPIYECWMQFVDLFPPEILCQFGRVIIAQTQKELSEELKKMTWRFMEILLERQKVMGCVDQALMECLVSHGAAANNNHHQ